MTNFERLKGSKSVDELALAMVKAVYNCAVFFPFIDEDDTEDLKGNAYFENVKKWLAQEANNPDYPNKPYSEDDKWLGMTIGDMW